MRTIPIAAVLILTTPQVHAVPYTLFHLTNIGGPPPAPPTTFKWQMGPNTLTMPNFQPTAIINEFGHVNTGNPERFVINRANDQAYGIDLDAWDATMKNPAAWPTSRLTFGDTVREHTVMGQPGIFTLDRLDIRINYVWSIYPSDLPNLSVDIQVAARGDAVLGVPEPSALLLILVAASIMRCRPRR